MSEAKNCTCSSCADTNQAPRSKKSFLVALAGGSLCILACAAGPVLIGLGVTLTAGTALAGLTALAIPAAAITAGIVAYSMFRKNRLKRNELTNIACNPLAIEPSRRQGHEDLFRTLLGKAESIKNNGRQLVLRYSLNSETLLELAAWIQDEQKCCSFLTFNIDVLPPKGDLILRLGDGKDITKYLAGLVRETQ